MATLSQWQKIDRVLSGCPFGNGSDGAYSSATIPTLTKDSCSGTATSTTLTTTSATFANGDILYLHQSRGTGVGQWEINRVVSGGGTTTLTLQEALHYTYTDSGASQAQAIKIPQYTNCTVQSGTWTVPSWDGNVGGFLPLAIKGNLTITGTTTGAGNSYHGGARSATGVAQGKTGEGSVGAGDVDSSTPNGSGGGGGKSTTNQCGGGGGGNGSEGADTAGNDAGGGTSGTADLTNITFGGSGGGGGSSNSGGTYGGGHGGTGGGIVILFVKNVVSVNSLIVTGGAGENWGGTTGGAGGGGGGAGGSVLIACQTATLGTAVVTAAGGAAGSGNGGENNGGAGGVGRIAVHHSGAVTGTTSPTFTDVSDPTLIESNAGVLMNFI